MRILFTGSRNMTDDQPIRDALDALGWGAVQDSTFVHGGARGCDALVSKVAADCLNVFVEVVEADWSAHGKVAGPMRNTQMVMLGADICLAFPEPLSKGTWDCIRKAADVGIPVRIYPQTTRGPRQ